MARGAAARGKRIAFGDGKKILWDLHSKEVFDRNPNIAPPGLEGAGNLEWVPFYKGHRIYNKQADKRWIWNMEFRPTPGEVYFSNTEQLEGKRHGQDFVLIEPYLEPWKTSSTNKDWGRAKYQCVADALRATGYQVAQFRYRTSGPLLMNVTPISTASFRMALSVLRHASLYIGHEGGLHHGAAAVGIPAVVLFGGWIPPSVTGYETHTNLTGGETEFCGLLKPCLHCRAALDRISVEEVVTVAQETLR